MPTIRTARPDDAPSIRALAEELGYEPTLGVVQAALSDALADPRQTVLVVDEAGVCVGWTQVVVASSLTSDPIAEVHGLVVAEGWRSQGWGSHLMDAAEEWAVEQGVRRLRVRTNVLRERAHRFYEKLWYDLAKQQKVYEKDLS